MKKIKKSAIIGGVIFVGIIGLSGKILIDKNIDSQAQPTVLPISNLQYFNSLFEPYAYENKLEYKQILNLYILVEMTNDKCKNEEFMKHIKYIGPTKSEISKVNTYNVELEYDEDGYICKVIVTENEENK